LPHSISDVSSCLAGKLSRYHADYIEIHLEESRASYISYRGRQLESIGRTADAGGNVRALINDGWGFVSFNSFNELDLKIRMAIKQAELAGKGKSLLSRIEPVIDTVIHPDSKNPVKLPLSEKKRLLDEYNELIWQTPELRTSVIGYKDSYKETILINSLGSHIRQQRADITLRLSAIATSDGEIQQSNISVGNTGDFKAISGLHSEIKRMANHAVELLSAPRVKGGQYTVVLDPVLAGVFVHEAFGHLSESDFLHENERLRQVMTLGKKFGSKELNIIDSAVMPDSRGSYKYDDEGTPAQKTYLIREGKLVGRLHSKETAAKMNEQPTGNARAISYRHPPIVRMSNTYIEPQSASFKDMISDIKEGIYVKNWYGGTTSMEMFTFSAGEAYMIRNGQIAEALKPVVLTGNVFTTLGNIVAIGNDLQMNQGGGCGKGSQYPLPVSNGSPHIKIKDCLVAGA